MYLLKNSSLTVSILAPIADRERFGTRYCTGGYIFQIEDAQHGPLLSGPTYPDSFNVFDGQGIPDAFNLSPLRATKTADSRALVLGVGICDLASDSVVEPCVWKVEAARASIRMATEQRFESYGVSLERSVTLRGRSIRSATTARNTGSLAIPIRWFRKAITWWAVAHVFNHQTHHRGQVTALLTQQGCDVGVTDLIAMLREEAAAVSLS